MSFFHIKRRLAYWFRARHRHGHGIHSPYLFGLLTNVIENKGQYYSYETIDRAWASLMRSSIQVGGDASGGGGVPEKLKYLVRRNDLLPQYGKMLFRLVNEFQPARVICSGSVTGMTLLYLAKADNRIDVTHFGSVKELLPVTKYLLETARVRNVTLRDGFPSFSSPEVEDAFIFVSYPDNPGECRKEIRQITGQPTARPIAMVVNGIHHSPGMEAIWHELIADEKVRVSLDFYTLGLAICRADLQKENFVIRY